MGRACETHHHIVRDRWVSQELYPSYGLRTKRSAAKSPPVHHRRAFPTKDVSRDSSTSVAIPPTALFDAEIFRAGLAAYAVGLCFERKLLAFVERAQTGAFDGADMNEHVSAAIVGLNEAEA